MVRLWNTGAILLLLSAGISGCLGWPFDDTLHEHAYWYEPGLAGAVENGSTTDPHDHHAGLPSDHLPWDQWESPYLLSRVLMVNPDMAHGIRLSSIPYTNTDNPGGEMVLHFSTFRGTPLEILRDTLIQFVNETGIEPDQQEKTVELAMKSWEDSFDTEQLGAFAGGQVTVQNVTGLDALIERLNESEPRRTSFDRRMPTIGQETLEWDHDDNTTWRLTYQIGIHSLTINDHKGDPQTLEVDTGDKARISLPRSLGDDQDRQKEWIRQGFESHGLPPPTFDRFHISTVTT